MSACFSALRCVAVCVAVCFSWRSECNFSIRGRRAPLQNAEPFSSSITGLFCGIQGSFSNNTATVPHVHRRNRIVFRKKALHCLINGVVFKITVFGRIQVSFSDNTAKYHTYIEGMGSSFDKKPCIVSLMGSSSNKRVFGRIQGSFSDNTVLFFERRSHSSVYVWCCCSTHSLTHTFFTPLSVV